MVSLLAAAFPPPSQNQCRRTDAHQLSSHRLGSGSDHGLGEVVNCFFDNTPNGAKKWLGNSQESAFSGRLKVVITARISHLCYCFRNGPQSTFSYETS